MKIAHVVTLISPDAAYGGPTRVAVNQCSALQDAGHEVTLFAAHRGFDSKPDGVGGVSAVLRRGYFLHPGLGFAGLLSPGLLWELLTKMRGFDVVHVHLARDLVTLPAALLARLFRVRFVTQTHGMVDRSDRRLARVIDAVATRTVLAHAHRCLCLTPFESRELDLVDPHHGPVEIVPNGVPTPRCDPHPSRPLEVLFLARLHHRKRPTHFVEAALRLAPRFPTATFALVGPDEGEGAPVRRSIDESAAGGRVAVEGPISPDDSLRRMARASIYVLPSINEPFPMSVLEAMSLGLPVIVTDTCGLADAVREARAGLVVGPGEDELTSAIENLLTDSELREEMGKNGQRLVRSRFSMEKVRDQLIEAYAAR